MRRSRVRIPKAAHLKPQVGIHSGLGICRSVDVVAPTVPAVVVSISDTGKLVNFDPVVDLVLQPSGGTDRIALQTLVSKLRIPRTGDQVLLIADPAHPGGYLYAGDGETA
nr:hypothetical protein [Streptomyces alboflavus]